VNCGRVHPRPPYRCYVTSYASACFLSDPPDTLSTMSKDITEPRPATDPYDDPVAYLAGFGIETELVSVDEPSFTRAA
jgi:hypothetical protein